MSRSYKKFPQFRDNLWGRSLKDGKRYNNRKIRRKLKDTSIDVGNGTDYRRFGLDSWDLWEYKSYRTKQDTIHEWYEDQYELVNGVKGWRAQWLLKYTLDEALIDWYKSYKRK